jgi:hypothetical protein
LALGFLLTDRHAFNFIINTADELCLINTQSKDRRTVSDKNEFTSFLELAGGNAIQLLYI